MKVCLFGVALLIGSALACKPNTTPPTGATAAVPSPATALLTPRSPLTDTLQRGGLIYPRTGKTAADFVPDNSIYAVQYEAEGDLNADGIADLAVVLQNKKDKQQGARPVLVLLGQSDKSYRLDQVSHFVFPVENNEANFPNYDTEDISISDSALHIQLYGVGPQGNLFSDFKYFGKDLLLTAIETYNMGAGSHSQIDYDPLKGSATLEVINTMEEDMPSETTVHPIRKKTFPFETADPVEIIRDVYQQIDSERE